MDDSSLPMASEEKKGVQVWFICLKEVEAQKAFNVGTQLAEKTGGIFNGINFFTLGSPPQYKQAANLFVAPEHVGEVVDTFAREFGLSQKDGYIFQALPSSQYIPRNQPDRTAN